MLRLSVLLSGIVLTKILWETDSVVRQNSLIVDHTVVTILSLLLLYLQVGLHLRRVTLLKEEVINLLAAARFAVSIKLHITDEIGVLLQLLRGHVLVCFAHEASTARVFNIFVLSIPASPQVLIARNVVLHERERVQGEADQGEADHACIDAHTRTQQTEGFFHVAIRVKLINRVGHLEEVDATNGSRHECMQCW